jgi:hypothetical protein
MSKRKVKKQDSMAKTNFFLSTLPFSPWLLIKKYREPHTYFEQNFTTGSYKVGIGRGWCSQ